MRCLKRETIIRYLDNELTVQVMNHVRRHLKECPGCRTALGETENQIAVLRRSIAGLDPENVLMPPFRYTQPEERRGSSKSAFLHVLTSWLPPRAWLRPAAFLLVTILIILAGSQTIINDKNGGLNPTAVTYEHTYLHTNPNTAWHKRQLVITITDGEENLVGKIVTSADEGTEGGSPHDFNNIIQNRPL
jgi:hypothetical protein